MPENTKLADIELKDLVTNPIGTKPVYQLEAPDYIFHYELDVEGEPSPHPVLQRFMNEGDSFILNFNDPDGNPVSYTWNADDPGCVRHDGHIIAQKVEPATFITCKYFAPSQYDIDQNESAATFPDEYLYDRALPNTGKCTNKEVGGNICGVSNCQFSCAVYEPDLIKYPVHFISPQKEIIVEQARINQGLRTFQTIIIDHESDNTDKTIETITGSEKELNGIVEKAIKLSKLIPDATEVLHQAPRKSFIKGLIAQ